MLKVDPVFAGWTLTLAGMADTISVAFSPVFSPKIQMWYETGLDERKPLCGQGGRPVKIIPAAGQGRQKLAQVVNNTVTQNHFTRGVVS